MKNILSVLVCFFLIAPSLYACDFCNCYLGLNPHYKKNIVGIRNYYSSYTGSHMSNSELQQMGLSKNDFREHNNKMEIHGQWYPSQKIQIQFSLPYNINTETINSSQHSTAVHSHHGQSDLTSVNASETIQGIADPLFIAQYQIFNKSSLDSSKYSHRLFAGAGIKFPLGNYRLEAGADPHERSHLPGTGSWDIITNATYLGKIGKTGFNLNVSYVLNSENDEYYQFGNRLNGMAIVYHQIINKKLLLLPNAGLNFEQAQQDHDAGITIYNTGGSLLFAHTGIDLYYKKISVNSAIEIPMLKYLNGNQPEIQYKFIVGLSYVLN